MKTVCCSILGFGAIGQGVAEVLLMKKEYLRSIGLEVKVVAVADSKGATVDPEGVNLADCLARKRTSGTVALESITGIEVISSVDHKLVIETTPTNIKTGEQVYRTCSQPFRRERMLLLPTKGLSP